MVAAAAGADAGAGVAFPLERARSSAIWARYGTKIKLLHFLNEERAALACGHETQLQPLPANNVTIFTSAHAALAYTLPGSSGCCLVAYETANEAETNKMISKNTPGLGQPADGIQFPHIKQSDRDALAHATEHMICCQWNASGMPVEGGDG